MFDAITQTIIATLAKSGAEVLARRIALANMGRSEIRPDQTREALERHLTFVKNWASDISIMESKQPRPLQQSFVDLDLELDRYPGRERRREKRKQRVSDLLRNTDNVILLGDPGAGKTTSLKRLAIGFLKKFDEESQIGIPILIRLQALHADESLVQNVLEVTGVELEYDEKLAAGARARFRENAVAEILSSLRACLLIDGLDELHPRAKARIIGELRNLLFLSARYRILITCRTAEYAQHFERAIRYVIEPLSDTQIELFAQKWIGEEKAKDLLLRIREAPYGGTEVLPLTLAHLCAIYQRTGSVPEKPKTIYRKIVRLLLEEWDEQRSVQRTSAYSNFEIDRKEEFLRAIAAELTVRGNRGGFEHAQLDRAYRAVCRSFALPESDCRRVVREIESHNGLILEVDYEKFDFSHRSIQEYLTAEYLLRLPVFPRERAVKFPNEMALVVAMSSDANHHFQVVVDAALCSGERDLAGFALPFLRRLSLEKVDFRQDRMLGKSITELFAATFYPFVGEVRQLGLPFGVSSRVFRDFSTLEGVRSSILGAIRVASIEANGGETWRLRWIPEKEAQGLVADRSIVIDSGFLQMAGAVRGH